MEQTGKVVAVLELVNGTSKAGNAFQKREFVIETQEQYPKKICFQLFGERVNECPSIGEVVKVNFDAESREWQGRWFTQLNAWRVEKQGAQATHGAQDVGQHPQPQPQQVPQPQQTSSDDLPF